MMAVLMDNSQIVSTSFFPSFVETNTAVVDTAYYIDGVIKLSEISKEPH